MAKNKRGVRDSIAETILESLEDLEKHTSVNKVTAREIRSLCLPKVQEFDSQRIKQLRKKLHLSQMAFANVMNMSVSTIQKWENGRKHPSGAATRLLTLMDQKGIDVIF